jgi:hypothetical protein
VQTWQKVFLLLSLNLSAMYTQRRKLKTRGIYYNHDSSSSTLSGLYRRHKCGDCKGVGANALLSLLEVAQDEGDDDTAYVNDTINGDNGGSSSDGGRNDRIDDEMDGGLVNQIVNEMDCGLQNQIVDRMVDDLLRAY